MSSTLCIKSDIDPDEVALIKDVICDFKKDIFFTDGCGYISEQYLDLVANMKEY